MKEVPIWSGADLGLDDASSRNRQARLYQPEERTECELVDAETPEEAARQLARALRVRGII